MLFRSCPEVADFKVEVVNTGDLDELVLSIEASQNTDRAAVAPQLAERTKMKFALRPTIKLIERGTLAREFESSVKAPRFVDRR